MAIIPTHLLCQMWANPPEVEFQGTISKSRFRRYLFTFSIKREIRLFHVAVVQKWQEVYKSVMHVRSCCFGN